MRRTLVAFLYLTALVAVAGAWGRTTPADQDVLQGTWRVVDARARMSNEPAMIIDGLIDRGTIEFAGTRVTMRQLGESDFASYDFTLDTLASPRRLRMIDLAARDSARWTGIYRVSRDTLRLSLPIEHYSNRPVPPAGFNSPNTVAYTFKRDRPSPPADVTGVVFLDANENGVRDSGEAGLPGVAVSNQDTVVVTDASGAFRMTTRGTGIVFVSTPDGYRQVGSFWKDVAASPTLAFPLATSPAPASFTFIHASDTHLSPASLPRTQRLRALADSIGPDFVIISGDLVRDALRVGEAEATGYYDMFMRERGAFRSPVFTVPGNHENFGIERDTSHVSASHPLYGRRMYHHYLGPDYYSFTRGGVHFVGLNTVDIDDQRYYGHVDSLQLAWLARDLALIPPSMPVITFDHIPFFSTFEGIGGYTDSPPAPTLITVNGKTAFRHVISNAGATLAILRKRNHVPGARRPRPRHRAHRIRDRRRQDAVQPGLRDHWSPAGGRHDVRVRRDALSRHQRRHRCRSVHPADREVAVTRREGR
jgi:uncharacterized protein (TIGR03067 family)